MIFDRISKDLPPQMKKKESGCPHSNKLLQFCLKLEHCKPHVIQFSMLCCPLLTFSKLTFSKNSFKNTIRVSNELDQNQDQHSVGLDLGPNCLQRLSEDGKSHH